MTDLQAAVEQYLASLSDDDWQALVVRVRPPMAVESGPSPHDHAVAYEFRYSIT